MDSSLSPTSGRSLAPPAKPNHTRIAIVAAALSLAAALGPAPVRAQSVPGYVPSRGEVPVTRTQVEEPNPPIEGRVDPDTYRIGPGDEFAFRHSDLIDPKILRVSPAGEILFPDAGAVFVAGLTLREAESKVREALRSYVRGKGLVFTLYRPRRFRLPVLGEVARPGIVTLSAPVRASEAIEAAGGIAPGGARRGIVVRRGADSLRVDLVRFETSGDLSGNPLVFETDVVFVPAAGRHVEIWGAVPHPGRYDLIPGDRVSDLVALAGGPLPGAALDRAELERFDTMGETKRRTILLSTEAALSRGAEDPELRELDRLFIPTRGRYKEGALVDVIGEAAHPGPYSIREGAEGVKSVLERAGGLTEFADVSRARIERKAESAARDTAFLRLADNGPDFLTDEERVYVKLRARERDAVSAGLSSTSDIALMDGDRIVIPRRYASVSVQGEVRSPGLVPYQPGRRADDYVRAAGGFTGRANKGHVRVTVARTGQQLKPSDTGPIGAGDTVWVPAKPQRSRWVVLRDVLTTAAQVATVYLVIHQATK